HRRGAAAGARAGAAQGVGVRRVRHRPRLGAHRAPLGGRRTAGLGLGSRHARALGACLSLLAPPRGGAAPGRRREIGAGVEVVMKRKPAVESASARIDARIKDLGDWRGKTLARMRKLIHQAAPKVVEEWKWMGTPIFSHHGIVCTGETYKSVVKLTFAKGAFLEDPARLFNSSLGGNLRRAIDIREGEALDQAAFK